LDLISDTTIELYQVDAFAEKLFEGNPAAVIIRNEWLPDQVMQQIAEENNLAETAYVVPEKDQYRIRWFTPVREVRLCGHATLASAHVLYQHLDCKTPSIVFESLSGPLTVSKNGTRYLMDFPADQCVPAPEHLDDISAVLGLVPDEVCKGSDDLLALVQSQSVIDDLKPDLSKLNELDVRGLLVTARGDEVDFVSRCFFPRYGIDEDPVTGSAHTLLAPFWVQKTGKQKLQAQQRSARSGLVHCELEGDRVLLGGTAVTYMQGKIKL